MSNVDNCCRRWMIFYKKLCYKKNSTSYGLMLENITFLYYGYMWKTSNTLS